MSHDTIPLLSFCIPTYNRSNLVKECVNSILSYPGNDIEVVAVDNHSPDDTQITLSEIQDSRFVYHRNDENIGAVRNILKSIRLARGAWVFSLSDEDIVTPVHISALMEILKSDQINGVSAILGNIRLENGKPYDSFYQKYEYEDKKYIKGDEAFLNCGLTHRYMSGFCLNKSLLQENDIAEGSINTFDIQPIVKLLTILTVRGDILTLNMDVCLKRSIPNLKSHVEAFNSNNYRHPDNRFHQFENYVRLSNDLNLSSNTFIQRMSSLFSEYLHLSTHGWRHTFTNEAMKEYFKQESDNSFNLKTITNDFYNKTTNLIHNLDIDAELKNQLISRLLNDKDSFLINEKHKSKKSFIVKVKIMIKRFLKKLN